MGVESLTRTVDTDPDLNEIWENPPKHLIANDLSIRFAGQQRVVPNTNAIGIFGAQKGDESKGTWSYRYSHLRPAGGVAIRAGGPGAGHMIRPENESEEVGFRMLPTSIDDGWVKIAGRGELVVPELVINEMQILKRLGYNPTPKNIMIDGAAFLAWDAHIQRDIAEEKSRGKDAIGTTKSGVGPAASDYTARVGLRMDCLLKTKQETERLVQDEVERQNRILTSLPSEFNLDPNETLEKFKEWVKILGPYIGNTYPVVTRALKENGNLIFEGAQAFGISLDTGFRGSVTSTDSGPGSFTRRYRTSENRLGWRIGVLKLVPTCVGNHVIHSPLSQEHQEPLYLRTEERGRPEAGTVSGRRRKYYWLSVPEICAAIETYNLNALVLAKVDAVDTLPEIRFGVEYVFPDGYTTTDYDPDDPRMLDERTRMNTLKLDGWKTSTAGLNTFEDAPRQLRAAVATLEHLTNLPIVAIGTGPAFHEAIYAQNSPFNVG